MWDLALDGNTSGSGSLGKWPSKLQTSWASLVTQTVKNLPAMQETWVQFLDWEYSPGEGNGSPLQYSCWHSPMDRGAWWRSLVGCSPWGLKESDTTEQLTLSLFA